MLLPDVDMYHVTEILQPSTFQASQASITMLFNADIAAPELKARLLLIYEIQSKKIVCSKLMPSSVWSSTNKYTETPAN